MGRDSMTAIGLLNDCKNTAMASGCYGRRLSELLQEQQEPFLVHRNVGRRGAGNVTAVLRVRKALLLWDLCFSCGARDRFRRLPVHPGDDDRDGARQLSPVSVLELRCSDDDELTTTRTHSTATEDGALDSKPSSESDHHHHRRFTFRSHTDCKVRAVEAEDKSKFQTEQQAVVSAWESIAADISRIPRMVDLDLALSLPEWRRRVGEEEVRQVGQSIEAMIFEEVRWEAVRDMLCLLCSSRM